MKTKNVILILAAAFLTGFTACNTGNTPNTSVETETDTVALSLGYSVGANLSHQFPNVNPQLIAKGIVESYQKKENPLFANSHEADSAIRTYLYKEKNQLAEENKKAGEAFLEENAKKEGIKVTESGLQYEVIKEGNGPKPEGPKTVVKVNYTGKTIDGNVFDSNKGGKPFQTALNRVIKGWTEGIQLMPVGSKCRFYIPSDLAYGKRGAGAKIGPNSTLIFDIELLEIVNK